MRDVGRGGPSLSLGGLSEAALANLLGAIVAVARGDVAEAEDRLGDRPRPDRRAVVDGHVPGGAVAAWL